VFRTRANTQIACHTPPSSGHSTKVLILSMFLETS
jgi:hypothetical protein